jgi:hypothetical protein
MLSKEGLINCVLLHCLPHVASPLAHSHCTLRGRDQCPDGSVNNMDRFGRVHTLHARAVVRGEGRRLSVYGRVSSATQSQGVGPRGEAP